MNRSFFYRIITVDHGVWLLLLIEQRLSSTNAEISKKAKDY